MNHAPRNTPASVEPALSCESGAGGNAAPGGAMESGGAAVGMAAPAAGVASSAAQVAETELAAAVEVLRAGGVIGLPTETVYGLAANAADQAAVASIYRIKGRPADHPLIVHVADVAAARDWAEWSPEAQRLADCFWPGPLSLVLKRRAEAPAWACGGQASIAIRIPSHPVFQRLMRALRPHGIIGLAAPSANPFGRISPSRAAHVRAGLGSAVPVVLDGGPSRVGLESTIVDLSRGEPVLLRPGHVTLAGLAQCLGRPVRLDDMLARSEHAARRAERGRDTGEGSGASASKGQRMNAGAGTGADVSRRVDAATAPGADGAAGPDTDAPRVPGALPSHYAPDAPLRLMDWDALAARLDLARARGQRVAVWSARMPAPQPGLFWRRRPSDADGAGRDLYDALHQLDALPVACILIERPPADAAWRALTDRLERAAA
ncbi:MAG: L-threonylcarbamoyladenylate synthase [Lautropia sp.]|nr:L-threonylcarbamoyladenylate synthase [Lautropia sp.]